MNCTTQDCPVEYNWFRDRILGRPGYQLQSQWFCSEECLEAGILQKLETHSSARDGTRTVSYQLKLEHVLVSSGLVSAEQLAGRKPDMELSQHLLSMGLVTDRDISLALNRIHNLPVINLNGRSIQQSALNTVPAEIVRTHEFFPLEFMPAINRLVLVTSNPASVPVMITLRGILGCQVAIYMSSEAVVRTMIDQYCDLSERGKRKQVEGLTTPDNVRDIASWIAHRAGSIGAHSLQVTRFGRFIWTRFIVGEETLNYVF